MFATFEAAVIINLLKIAKLAIAARSTVAQLSHITFKSDGSAVVMIATDLEMELTLDVPGASMAVGSFNVSLPDLQKFLASADKGGLVTVQAQGDVADVTSDGMTNSMTCYPSEDMPSTIEFEPVPDVAVLPERDLHDILTACLHSVSSEETRYYLRGVFLHASAGGNIAFVSTDGHRLSLFETSLQAPASPLANIIPSGAVKALLAALNAKSDLPCVIHWSKTKTVVTGSNFKLITKNVDGVFPDYTRVIPQSGDVVILDKAGISKPLARIVKLSTDRAYKTVLDFSAGKIRTPDNKLHAPLAFQGVTSTTSIGFNGTYIADILNLLKGDTVALRVQGADCPAVFLQEDPRWIQALFVAMPLRH